MTLTNDQARINSLREVVEVLKKELIAQQKEIRALRKRVKRLEAENNPLFGGKGIFN